MSISRRNYAAPLLNRSGVKYIFDGNSQTEGINGSTSAFPYRTGLLLGKSVTNFGVGGQNTRQMRADAITQVVAAMQTSGGNVLVASEVRNDLVSLANSSNLGTIAQSCVNELWGYFDDIKTAATNAGKVGPNNPLRFVTWTIPDCTRTSNAIGIAALRNLFAQANTLIKAQYKEHCHSYYDILSDVRLSNSANSTYYPDQVHWTPAGEIIAAQMAYQAIVNLRA